MSALAVLAGHCHCGAIGVRLHPGGPVEALPFRACACEFCRRIGAAYTSDPDGRLHIEAQPGSVRRYRFGTRTADFLLCAECGCLAAVIMQTDLGLQGVVNVRGVGLPGFEGREPSAMTYDSETPAERVARRRGRWTPAVLAEAQPNA